jgi:hypothetical protein
VTLMKAGRASRGLRRFLQASAPADPSSRPCFSPVPSPGALRLIESLHGISSISAIIQTEPGEMAEWLKAAVC